MATEGEMVNLSVGLPYLGKLTLKRRPCGLQQIVSILLPTYVMFAKKRKHLNL